MTLGHRRSSLAAVGVRTMRTSLSAARIGYYRESDGWRWKAMLSRMLLEMPAVLAESIHRPVPILAWLKSRRDPQAPRE